MRVSKPNSLIRSLTDHAGRIFVSLDAEGLLAEARRRTGLEDFGEESFRAPLHILLEDLEANADLSAIGRIAARHDILRLLTNRLLLAEDRKRFPEIATERIRQPLFIVGLPRTGTTLLHGLMAQDPANRTPLSWEVMFPSPPPKGDQWMSDPRVMRTEKSLNWMGRLAPDFKAIHPLSARLPQECIAITAGAFESNQFETTHRVPGYSTWLGHSDMRRAYEFHRRFLQQLQWLCGGERWVLKAPAHLMGLRALFETYPDAGIIQTHRDPSKVVASVASLVAVLRGAFSRHISPTGIGKEVLERWSGALTRATACRSGHQVPDERFLDVHYSELVRDPMGTVERVYRHFGLELSLAAATKMRGFVANNPKDRHGAHRYSLEQFGLRAQQVAERFQIYQRRFAIETEAG